MRKDLHWNMNNITVNQMNEHVYRINEIKEAEKKAECRLLSSAGKSKSSFD